MIDRKEYARQMRENVATNVYGIVQVSPEMWEEIACIIERGAEWISVKDELPNNRENLKYFLCRCILDGDNNERWAFYQVLRWYVYDINDDGSFYRPHFQEDGYNGMSVTHWMSLPAPPEGGDPL